MQRGAPHHACLVHICVVGVVEQQLHVDGAQVHLVLRDFGVQVPQPRLDCGQRLVGRGSGLGTLAGCGSMGTTATAFERRHAHSKPNAEVDLIGDGRYMMEKMNSQSCGL